MSTPTPNRTERFLSNELDRSNIKIHDLKTRIATLTDALDKAEKALMILKPDWTEGPDFWNHQVNLKQAALTAIRQAKEQSK